MRDNSNQKVCSKFIKTAVSSILILVLASLLFYSFTSKLTHISTNNKNSKTQTIEKIDLDRKSISGKILYQKGDKIVRLNPKNNTIMIIGEVTNNDLLGAKWVYQNGSVFVSSGSGVVRIDISKNKKKFIPLVDDKTYKEWINKVNYFARVDGIFPSADGNKVIAIAPRLGDAISKLYLIDFGTNKVAYLNDEVAKPQWFSDGKHILFINSVAKKQYSQDLATTIYIYDISSSEKKVLETGNIPASTVRVSREGLQVLWMDNKSNTQIGPFGETYHPDMVFRSISSLFPETKITDQENYYRYNSNLDNTSDRTPFTKFPVIARDYKGVTKIIPGGIYNHFFMEINSGKSEIYFTDSVPWGTFKKINPNNAYSYYLLDYSLMTKKVLALKYRWKGIWDSKYGIQRSNADASLVILDEGNYAETVAGIDNANFYEKEIGKLDKEVTPTYYSRDSGAIFSPDGKFVLAPLLSDSGGPSKFKIISADGKGEISISENLGQLVYWVE